MGSPRPGARKHACACTHTDTLVQTDAVARAHTGATLPPCFRAAVPGHVNGPSVPAADAHANVSWPGASPPRSCGGPSLGHLCSRKPCCLVGSGTQAGLGESALGTGGCLPSLPLFS